MTTKTRTNLSPQALHRKRFALIAGIVTVLPVAAIAPSLLFPGQAPAPLLAIEEMAVDAAPNALANERAVAFASATRQEFSLVNLTAAAARPGSLDAQTNGAAKSETPSFNGRPIRAVGTLTMRVTAYSPDEQSCGESADGITASGYSVWTNGMKMVAADTDVLPFGSLISVPGYDDAAVVPVLDRGGAIKGNRLDVLYPTHDRAMEWGVQELEVTVWEYADGLPGDFQIAAR